MIDTIRQFTIRTRMLGAIAMVMALLTVVGGAGLWGITRVTDGSAKFIAATHAEAVLLTEMGLALGNVRRYEKDQLINAGNAAQLQAYRAQWQAAIDRVRDRSRQIAANGLKEAGEVSKTLDGLLRKPARSNNSPATSGRAPTPPARAASPTSSAPSTASPSRPISWP